MNILTILSENETAYYNNLFNKRRYFRYCQSRDSYEIEKYNYEENIINNYNDPVKLGSPDDTLKDWKIRYYKHYYNIDIQPQNPKDNSLNNILEEYIRGLVWTSYYYYDKCKDYEWFYEHHHGPFISDLKKYIERFPNIFSKYENLYSSNGIWYYDKIKPLHQLLLVLPHESSYLIPSAYRSLMFDYRLKTYFPDKITNIPVDYIGKTKSWQNILMLDIIPPRYILKYTSKIILKEEMERNRSYKEYVKEKNNIIHSKIIPSKK